MRCVNSAGLKAAYSVAPVERTFPCAGLRGAVRAELYCRDARAALLLPPLSLVCIWVFSWSGQSVLTLLPQGCGGQDRLAVCRTGWLCVLRISAVEGHHPLLKWCPSAQEPHGAPARDDKHSRVPSLQVPADVHQHSVMLFLLTLPVACIWRSCLEEHRRAVVAGPCPLPSLPARWASGCNFEFLFFGTKVCALYAFVSSAELEVPGAGECLVLRTVLITSLFSCLSVVSGVRALFRSKGMKTVAKPDLACCFPCRPPQCSPE